MLKALDPLTGETKWDLPLRQGALGWNAVDQRRTGRSPRTKMDILWRRTPKPVRSCGVFILERD